MDCGHCKASGVTVAHVKDCSTPLDTGMGKIVAVVGPVMTKMIASAPERKSPFNDAIASAVAAADKESFAPAMPVSKRQAAANAKANYAADKAARTVVAETAIEPAAVKPVRGGEPKCWRCGGNGQFNTGMMNGKPVGPGGICFKCDGKGYQTDCGEAYHAAIRAEIKARTRKAGGCCDVTRCDNYDNYFMKIRP